MGPPSAPFDVGARGDTVRDVLRRALSDPDLDIVYARVGSGGWINELGEGTTAATASTSRSFTAIHRGGKPIAGLIHDSARLHEPARLQAAIEAASLAIDNEQLKAQVHAQLAEVQASRARIVDAGDRELRRVERNLHDGAQQRLVGLALTLHLAMRRATDDAVVTELLVDAASELDAALDDLRSLARGIHPAIVDDAGLGGALETLAERPGVPVELTLELSGRLPESVEVAAYYLVAEALTNINKHANAHRAGVRAAVADGVLRIAVSDDGTGGARATPGSGLEGLADRVSALGGDLAIDSSDRGTVVSAEIPLAAPPDIDSDGARRRMRAVKWIGWENWEGPAELYEQITDEDYLRHAKAMMLCVGGNGRITAREREWLVGYLTAAGTPEPLLEVVATYDDSDALDDLLQSPGMATAQRGLLYDAVRIGSSDGPLAPGDLDHLHRAAEAMDVPRDVVTELHEIVVAEHALRSRRYELIVAPVLPAPPPPPRS